MLHISRPVQRTRCAYTGGQGEAWPAWGEPSPPAPWPGTEGETQRRPHNGHIPGTPLSTRAAAVTKKAGHPQPAGIPGSSRQETCNQLGYLDLRSQLGYLDLRGWTPAVSWDTWIFAALIYYLFTCGAKCVVGGKPWGGAATCETVGSEM